MNKKTLKRKLNRETQSIDFRPISIPINTITRILHDKSIENPMAVFGLYCFMYYCAILQKTDKPWITSKYIGKSLHLCRDTVSKYRKQLTDLNLIQDKAITKNGRFVCHVTHLKFYSGMKLEDSEWMKRDSIFHSKKLSSRFHHRRKFPDTGEPDLSYSKLKGNAYSKLKKNISARLKQSGGECGVFDSYEQTLTGNNGHTPAYKLSIRLKMLLKRHGRLTKEPYIPFWSREFTQLMKPPRQASYHYIKSLIKWYNDHIRDHLVPKVKDATEFRKKFTNIEDARNRWLEDQGQGTVEPEDDIEYIQDGPVETID